MPYSTNSLKVFICDIGCIFLVTMFVIYTNKSAAIFRAQVVCSPWHSNLRNTELTVSMLTSMTTLKWGASFAKHNTKSVTRCLVSVIGMDYNSQYKNWETNELDKQLYVDTAVPPCVTTWFKDKSKFTWLNDILICIIISPSLINLCIPEILKVAKAITIT